MAQLTIYIPDELEEKIRDQAEREGKSLSAFVADLTRKAVAPDAWSEAFLALYGSCEGELEEPSDRHPETRNEL